MGKKLTVEEIKNRISEISSGTLEYTPELNEEYLTKDELSTFTHKCGFKFKRSVGNVIYRKIITCPKCSPQSFVRTEETLKKILNKNNIKLIEVFTGVKDIDSIKVEFPCGCQSIRKIGNIILGTAICLEKKCDLKKKCNLTNNEVQERLKSFKYGSFTLLSNYTNISTDIKYQCDKCGFIDSRNLINLQSLEGKCKNCFGSVQSIKEEYLAILLKDFNIDFIRQFKIDNYRYDFYLPKYNILLEYDGSTHISKVYNGNKIECNDQIKDELANSNNYNLIRINHTESIVNKINNILLLFNDYGVTPSTLK